MKFTLRAKSHRENRLWHYNTCTIYLFHWDADNLENTTKSDLARNTACSSTAALQFQPGSTLSKTTPARSLYLSRISLTMTFLPLAISPSFSRWAHMLKGGKFSTGGITMVYCCFSYFTRMPQTSACYRGGDISIIQLVRASCNQNAVCHHIFCMHMWGGQCGLDCTTHLNTK